MTIISRLEDLSKDKVTVMLRILEHEGLRRALFYNHRDFLDESRPLPTVDDLIYKRIFPYRFLPDTVNDVGTFITMSFRGYRPSKSYYKSGNIYLNAICHIDDIQTDYGFLKYDYICSELDKLMNHEHGIGIGKTNFTDMDEIYVNDKFQGQYVAYKLYEFN